MVNDESMSATDPSGTVTDLSPNRLARAQAYGVLAGWAGMALLYPVAFVLRCFIEAWFGKKAFLAVWLAGHYAAMAVFGATIICGIVLLVRRPRPDDASSAGLSLLHGAAVLGLAVHVAWEASFSRALTIAFWPTPQWMLTWGVFWAVILLFLPLPVLCHIARTSRRSNGFMDASLMILLAVLTLDGLGVWANGYTRESLVSLRLLNEGPFIVAMFIAGPWLLGAYLMNTRKSRDSYWVVAVGI